MLVEEDWQLKIPSHIVHLLVVVALVAIPNVQFVSFASANDISDISYDTCVSEWQGSWIDLPAAGVEENPLSKSVEEVFCGHFMSVEDFPVENGSADVAVTTPLFLAPASRPIESVSSSLKISLPIEVIPHSLASEVAPHPPKSH